MPFFNADGPVPFNQFVEEHRASTTDQMTSTTDYQRAKDAGYTFEKYATTSGPMRWAFESPQCDRFDSYFSRTSAATDAVRHAFGFWHGRAENFATAIDNIPAVVEDPDIFDTIAGLVVQMGVTTADFIELDERPGQFYVNGRGYTAEGSLWHSRLRRARNSPESGLFEALKDSAAARQSVV